MGGNHIRLSSMNKPIAVSFPEELIEEIDRARGDIPRSRYVLRLVQIAFQEKRAEPQNARPPEARPQGKKEGSP